MKIKVSVAQSCPTLLDLMDCSPPGSSVHGILQARILEWVAIPFSRESSSHRDQTQVSFIAGRLPTILTTREEHMGEIISLEALNKSSCLFVDYGQGEGEREGLKVKRY